MTNQLIIIQTSFPIDVDETTLCDTLIQKKLAACIHKTPPITSYYTWDNAIQKDNEYLLLIKTFSRHFNDISNLILEHHPYDIPEILSFNINQVSQKYSSWIAQSLV